MMESTKLLVLAALLLTGWSARGGTDYDDYYDLQHWVERQCPTNAIPDAERIYVMHHGPPAYAGIVRFHKGITLREIIDQTPFKQQTVDVALMRPEVYRTGHNTIVYTFKMKPSGKPKFKVKSQDVIRLRDPSWQDIRL